MIRALIISKFDTTQGPIILHSLPDVKNERMLIFKEIPRLMDLINDEGFFVNSIGNIFTANYYFMIDSINARGKKDSILFTIAFRPMNDDEDWKENIMIFLQKQESTLKDFSVELKLNEELNASGIFSRESENLVKQLLIRYYRRIFIKNSEFFLKRDFIGNKIWIMTPAGFNGLNIINLIKK